MTFVQIDTYTCSVKQTKDVFHIREKKTPQNQLQLFSIYVQHLCVILNLVFDGPWPLRLRVTGGFRVRRCVL